MFRGTEKTQTTNLQGRRKQWSLARALLDKQQRAWLSQSMEPSEPEHTVFKRSIGSSAEVGGGRGCPGSKGGTDVVQQTRGAGRTVRVKLQISVINP